MERWPKATASTRRRSGWRRRRGRRGRNEFRIRRRGAHASGAATAPRHVGAVARRSGRTRRAEAGRRSLGDSGRVPGACAHRRPSAHRGRSYPSGRVGARAWRRRRHRRTRRPTRARARSDGHRNGGPVERVARPRLRHACRPRLPRSRVASPVCETHLPADAASAPPSTPPVVVPRPRFRQFRTTAGSRRSPAIHRHPNEASPSRMSTSKPTANGLLHWPNHSKMGCSHSTLGRDSRWPTRRPHFKAQSPAAPPARQSSRSTEAPSCSRGAGGYAAP